MIWLITYLAVGLGVSMECFVQEDMKGWGGLEAYVYGGFTFALWPVHIWIEMKS